MPEFKTSAIFTGKTGKDAEVFICKELKLAGYKILAQNWHSPFGEIDIIAKIETTICFIEVKYRQNDTHGNPAEFVTKAKRNRIAKTAQWWLTKHPKISDAEPSISFDIASVLGSKCHYINNAFEPNYAY